MRRYIIIVISLFFLLLLIGSPLRRIYAPFRYRELVKYYANSYNLDWLLVSSIVYHESRFRYNAESNKGARGLMQIMPDTGFELAQKLGLKEFSVDKLFKPTVNLELGCCYFSGLVKEFNNDIRLALAAYNAGKGSIYRYYPKNKGDLSYPSNNTRILEYPDIHKYLYPETRRYVSRVSGTYRLLKLMDKVWKI